MMTAIAPHIKMTAEAYLKQQRSGSREQTEKYEFFNQKLRLMAGASPNHNEITGQLMFLMRSQVHQVQTKPRIYAGDMRIVSYVKDKNYFYPDIVVIEGKPYYDDENGDNLVNPTLIIEVLSDSTESIDRGDKFKSYLKTPSMKEYLLISQKEPCIEQFFKDENGRWQVGDIITEGTFKLHTQPFELSVDAIYRNVEFTDTPSVSDEEK